MVSDDKRQAALKELTKPGSMFEVGSALIRGTDYPVYANAPATLAEVFAAGAAQGDKEFVIYQDERYTFAQIQVLAANFAHNLRSQLGVKKGDRVAIAMRNNPQWVIAFIGIVSSGAVAVPLNSWWGTQELEYALADSGARVVVADLQRAELIEPLRSVQELQIIGVGDVAFEQAVNFEELTAGDLSVLQAPADLTPEDDATILYTSGSTGQPKGAVSTHRGVISALLSWLCAGFAAQVVMGKKESLPPVALLTIPLFHVTGCHSIFILSYIIGRKLVIMYKWDVDDALRLIEREKVTYFNGVPTMSHELLNAPRRDEYDLSSLSDIYSGGAARPAKQVSRISKELKSSPGTGYGLTETNALGTVATSSDYLQRPGSAGQAVPAVTTLRVIDEQGSVLAPGEVGEICIKSPANVRAYWNKPEATAEAFVDGWFHTGDAGYLDDEGYVFIVDRIKDIIIRGGENISCLEVEESIYADARIAEAVVYGLPDDRLGEIVAASIYLVPGSSVSADEVRQRLGQSLAAYKVPHHIDISSEQLPRTGTGKLFKREVKRLTIEKLGLDN